MSCDNNRSTNRDLGSLEMKAQSLSIASRFATQLVVITTLIVVAAAGILYEVVSRELAENDEHTLNNRMETITKILQADGDTDALLKHEAHEYIEGLRPIFLRVFRPDGRIWVETPKMPAIDGSLYLAARGGVTPAFWSERGRSYLIVSSSLPRYSSSGRTEHVVQVAIDITRDYELMRHYRLALLFVLLASALGAGLLAKWTAARSVKPIKQFSEALDAVNSRTLSARLTVVGLPSELLGLAGNINSMLARLERSQQALQEFADDVAHEVRTPLANISLASEVALRKPRSAVEYQSVLESQLEECERLKRLISDLLFLADGGPAPNSIAREQVEICNELSSIREYFEGAVQDHELQLTVHCEKRLWAQLNRPLLQRAVINLVDNAMAHTPARGHIKIAAKMESDNLCISVSDSGVGISEKQLPYIFDRFYHGSEDQTSSKPRLGLGLSIVKKIVESHGGTVTATSDLASGTTIFLNLPAQSAS